MIWNIFCHLPMSCFLTLRILLKHFDFFYILESRPSISFLSLRFNSPMLIRRGGYGGVHWVEGGELWVFCWSIRYPRQPTMLFPFRKRTEFELAFSRAYPPLLCTPWPQIRLAQMSRGTRNMSHGFQNLSKVYIRAFLCYIKSELGSQHSRE